LGLYEDPMVAQGAAYMKKIKSEAQWFTYGHFYEAQVMYMIGGDDWRDWYAQMKPLLVPKVKTTGELYHWDHISGRTDGGSVYATAVYTMILAMPYNYLPLYQR